MSFFPLRNWSRLAAVALAFTCSLPISLRGEEAARPAWQLFPAGALPKGIMLTEGEIVTLPDGVPAEQTYLIGQFVVTAAAAKRAVFRSNPGSIVRIIVEYPAGFNTPPENAVVTLDNAHPLLITSIRHGNEGQITVYTREVVKP